jgi:uncharacterized membrane protein YfcA
VIRAPLRPGIAERDALALACGGMWVGQTVRLRLSASVFRRGFFVDLLLLGLYQLVAFAL